MKATARQLAAVILGLLLPFVGAVALLSASAFIPTLLSPGDWQLITSGLFIVGLILASWGLAQLITRTWIRRLAIYFITLVYILGAIAVLFTATCVPSDQVHLHPANMLAGAQPHGCS
jgi:hypothetical protein